MTVKFINRVKHSIRDFYILYADRNDLLAKAEKALHPLPEGCELLKLTRENMNQYKCQWNINQIMSDEVDEAWAVIDNNEIVGYHHGTYRGGNSMLFKVRNCDYEHTEIMVDERYRRKGMAIYILYHVIKNLDSQYVKENKVSTMIRPDNTPSIKLHELIGFKIDHRVKFFHKAIIKNGKFRYLNFPYYTI